MTGGLQVPERYLFPDAVGCWLPGRVAALLVTRTDVAALRIRVRSQDPEVDAVLMALMLAANRWTASVGGSHQRKPTEVVAPSAVMSTTDVADALDVTSARVRQLCRSGRLRATRTGRSWVIARTDLAHYRAATDPASGTDPEDRP